MGEPEKAKKTKVLVVANCLVCLNRPCSQVKVKFCVCGGLWETVVNFRFCEIGDFGDVC